MSLPMSSRCICVSVCLWLTFTCMSVYVQSVFRASDSIWVQEQSVFINIQLPTCSTRRSSIRTYRLHGVLTSRNPSLRLVVEFECWPPTAGDPGLMLAGELTVRCTGQWEKGNAPAAPCARGERTPSRNISSSLGTRIFNRVMFCQPNSSDSPAQTSLALPL